MRTSEPQHETVRQTKPARPLMSWVAALDPALPALNSLQLAAVLASAVALRRAVTDAHGAHMPLAVKRTLPTQVLALACTTLASFNMDPETSALSPGGAYLLRSTATVSLLIVYLRALLSTLRVTLAASETLLGRSATERAVTVTLTLVVAVLMGGGVWSGHQQAPNRDHVVPAARSVAAYNGGPRDLHLIPHACAPQAAACCNFADAVAQRHLPQSANQAVPYRHSYGRVLPAERRVIHSSVYQPTKRRSDAVASRRIGRRESSPCLDAHGLRAHFDFLLCLRCTPSAARGGPHYSTSFHHCTAKYAWRFASDYGDHRRQGIRASAAV